MWIASTLGFFSIVKKGAPGQWQIRARVGRDIDNLTDALSLPRSAVVVSTNTDYRYRLLVNEQQLARVFIVLQESINYPNFKDAVKHTPGQENKVGAYMRIWGIMEEFQPGRRYLPHYWEHQSHRGHYGLATPPPEALDGFWDENAPEANPAPTVPKKKKPSGAYWRRKRKEREKLQSLSNPQ